MDSIDRQFPFRLSECKREPRGFGYRARIGYISPSVIELNALYRICREGNAPCLRKTNRFGVRNLDND
jgi:hypothetical protein